MNYSFKHTIMVFSLLLFAGCDWFSRSDAKTSEEEPVYIMKNVQDVISLFPKNVEEIEQRVEYAIEKVKVSIQKIKDLDDSERTFENTARALDEIGERFSVAIGGVGALKMVSPEKDLRDASNEACIKISSFAVDVFLNVDLYNAFKGYVEGNAKKEKLNNEQQYFLEQEMKGFKRSGLHLPAKELEKVKEIKKELSKLNLKFESNVAQDNSSIEVERKDLTGMEDHFIDNLEKTDDGKYILKCDYPTVFGILQHCKVEKTRHDLYLKFDNRAYPANQEVLENIIAKRDELAKLLGFDSYAAFDLDEQMVGSLDRAEQFIIDLINKASVKEQKEFDLLKSDLPEGVKLTDGKFDPWNVKFVKEFYKQKHFDVDDRIISEYFPMEKTVQGIFNIYQKFLGLKFKEIKPKGLWHKDVSVIEIHEKGSGYLRGYIVLDLYPRENKFSHACHDGIVSTYQNKSANNGFVPSVSVLIANFPKSTKDRPSLLKHSDVETFFHEFGHAMHALLGKTELASFSGTATKTDFVEMPSQMFEEWMWDKDMLEMVSSHYKTGVSLPDVLIDKMIALKRFDTGSFVQRQGWLGLIAFNCFKSGAKKDVKKIVQSLHEKYCEHIRFEPKTNMYASFGHLCCYGAKYYGYMWSKVFALDLFETIKQEGLLNYEIGEKLINKVLGKGGSVDPNKLLVDFLGREPNQDAFLRDLGL